MASLIDDNQKIFTEMNLIPLVDIVLVVLIIFMVTANLIIQPAIEMELPKADTGESKERDQFSLLLGKDGSVAIGERIVHADQVGYEFQRIFNDYKKGKIKEAKRQARHLTDNQAKLITGRELTMVIQADTEVTHGRIIHFIDIARKVGIFNYAFNVTP